MQEGPCPPHSMNDGPGLGCPSSQNKVAIMSTLPPDMEKQTDLPGVPVQGHEAAKVNLTPVTLLPS